MVVGRFQIGNLKREPLIESKVTIPSVPKLKSVPSRESSKGDSLSDAEGMTGLRRLLRKENIAPPSLATSKTKDEVKPAGFGLKKSVSANNTSYWSRISASQPSFLRKFFEKVSPGPSSEKEKPKVKPVPTPTPASTEAEKAREEEPLLAMNVAQKASHFMKLEHEQRFSKWRTKDDAEGRSRLSRYSTQPVTTDEVISASKILTTNTKCTPEEHSSSRPIPISPEACQQSGDKSSSAGMIFKHGLG